LDGGAAAALVVGVEVELLDVLGVDELVDRLADGGGAAAEAADDVGEDEGAFSASGRGL